MNQIRLIVEPTPNTFSGYHVVIKWTRGQGFRSCAFTTWQAMFNFLKIQNLDEFQIVVHSEYLE